jgi:hypothetical protein
MVSSGFEESLIWLKFHIVIAVFFIYRITEAMVKANNHLFFPGKDGYVLELESIN